MQRLRVPLVLSLLAAQAGAALAQGGPAKPVVVAPVEQREVTETLAFVGTVEPIRQSLVGSEVEGLVVEVLAREGERVEKGQPLARLRTRPLELRLAAARAQAELRRHELAEQENGSRPEEVEEVRAQLSRAQAELELRRWQRENAQRLLENGALNEDELKAAGLAARQAEQRVRETQASLRLVEAGPRAERVAQARARLAFEEATVAGLEDQLARHTVCAPFAGYVVAEIAEAGEWLSRGSGVSEIAALEPVDVVVHVPEGHVNQLALGLGVSVTVEAVGPGPLEGKIVAVVPRANPRAHSFPVKVRLENRRREDGSVPLKAGMFARVGLSVGDRQLALFVPKDAVVLGGAGGPAVFVVQDGKAQPVPVELGVAVDGVMRVLNSPLRAGQQVVVRGNERLRPGEPVLVQEGR